MLVIIIVLTSCSPIGGKQTYTYQGSWTAAGLNRDKRCSGDVITLNWKAQLGAISYDTNPAKVVLETKLVGLYISSDVFLEGVRQSTTENYTFPKEMVLVSIPSIQTDNWTNKSYDSKIVIPSDLEPAYYNLYYAVTVIAGGKKNTIREDYPLQVNGYRMPNPACNRA
jgi:hypothetical protein